MGTLEIIPPVDCVNLCDPGPCRTKNLELMDMYITEHIAETGKERDSTL